MTYSSVRKILSCDRKRWLVTGVAGFIGSNILEELLNLDQEVVGLDNLSTGNFKNLKEVERLVSPTRWKRFSFIQGDICDYHTTDWGTYFVLWCSYALLFILACLTAVMISWYISGRLNHWFVSIPYRVRREQQPLLNEGTIAVYPPEYKVKDDSIQDTN